MLNLLILLTAYILYSLTPQYQPVIVLCVIGIALTFMWWMNIDSYQLLIKVKYAKVLEYLETKKSKKNMEIDPMTHETFEYYKKYL